MAQKFEIDYFSDGFTIIVEELIQNFIKLGEENFMNNSQVQEQVLPTSKVFLALITFIADNLHEQFLSVP